MSVVPEWIEAHCVVPDGFRKGERFVLYDYQLRYFGAFYLVKLDAEWVPANPVLAPAFVYRRGLLIGPQKLGKGPHTAAHTCLEGVGPALFAGWAGDDDGYVCVEHGCRCGWEYPYEPGEPKGMRWPTPLIQITAFSEEQTDNIYDALRPMIELGPLSDLVPKTGEEFIRLPGGGRIDTVTSSAQSRLGQRVTFVPQDEVGIWTPKNKMSKVADTQYRGLSGMGGRASLSSNAWDPSEDSVGQVQFESPDADIWRQFDRAPANLSYANKRERSKIHRIVYPPDTWRTNGGHVDLDAIEAEADSLAQRDPPQAMRFYGNIIARSARTAVDPQRWKELARPDIVVPDGTQIGLGFDGSISGDATMLYGCTREGHTFEIGTWEAPTDQWGATIDGWAVPRAEVHQRIAETFDRYKVGRFLVDPPKWWSELDEWVKLYNVDARGQKLPVADAIVMGFDTYVTKRMGAAIDRWLTAIAEKTHTHDGSDPLRRHILAAHLEKVGVNADDGDGRTIYKLVKGDDLRKIDGAVADVLALEAAMTMPDLPKRKTPLAALV